MHKQDENDLEILSSFIRRHVKILWNQFFCIYINLILTWILISAEKVYVFAKYKNFKNDKRTTIWFGYTCACDEKKGGGVQGNHFILDASENN